MRRRAGKGSPPHRSGCATHMTAKRIVVIDDEDLSREGVAEVLREEGYQIAVAADGREAVAVLDAFAPHLVVTALQTPRLDGLGVINHVKQFYPTTPVMIFTADVTIDARRKAERLGVQDYLNKPLNFADMLRRIDHVLTE